MLEQHDSAACKRARAVRRYIRALETGDGDALGTVLRQAQDDATLEKLLLTLHGVYLDAEEIAIHPDDVTYARKMIQARATENGHYLTGSATAMSPRRQEQVWERSLSRSTLTY